MQKIVGHFEELHFTESNLGIPVLGVGVIEIPATGVLPLKGYPLHEGTLGPLAGTLIFTGVTKSVRKMTEYIGDPKQPQGFKEERTLVDIDIFPVQSEGTQFMLEGILAEPVAWVEWEVVASTFEFHID